MSRGASQQGRMAPGGPEVTVLIPAYNAAPFIEDAIRSAAAQTFRDLEILIIDDGSTDDTAERALACGVAVRLLRVDHGGVSSARNHGLRQARGRMVTFLDSDDLLEPDLIERARQMLQRHPDLGFVFCNFRIFCEDGTVTPPRIPPGAFGGVREPVIVDAFQEVLRHAYPIAPSGLCAPREALEQAGFFDERLRGSEDFEYWIRIYSHRPIGCLTDPLVRVRRQPGSLTHNPGLMIEGIAASVNKICARLRAEGRTRHAAIVKGYGRLCMQPGVIRMLQGGDAVEARRALFRHRGLLRGPLWPVLVIASMLPGAALRWLWLWLGRGRARA